MRIAVLSNAAVTHTVRWAEYLRGRGHEVRVWSLEPPLPGFSCDRLPCAPLPGVLRYPLAVPSLRRALAHFQPELVDAHYVPNYGLMGVLSGRRPLAVSAWGSDLLVAAGRNGLQRARARFVLRSAQLVLTDGTNLDAAARELGADPTRTRMIPWGVDASRFRPRERQPGLVLSTRMHEPVYDIPTVLRAAAGVMARRPDVHLVLAGEGSLRAEHERLAARWLPAGRYQFIGRVDPEGLAAWLGRAEVYVSASLSDSTSVSLLEAMAAGAVPVVSDIEGNRPWIGNGVEGRTFPPGDAEAAARVIDEVLADPEAAGAMRERALHAIHERGELRRNMGRIETLFEALVAGRPLPEAET